MHQFSLEEVSWVKHTHTGEANSYTLFFVPNHAQGPVPSSDLGGGGQDLALKWEPKWEPQLQTPSSVCPSASYLISLCYFLIHKLGTPVVPTLECGQED